MAGEEGGALLAWEFVSPPRILFGAGVRRELPAVARAYGRRPLVVTGRSHQRVKDLLQALESAGLQPVRFGVCGEPEVATVRQAVGLARQEGCDLVIGVGGGSALDTAKAVAGLVPRAGEVEEFLEVVGQARPLPGPGLPFLAVPTTAGTGAEVTRNAVLAVPEHRVKVSFRSPYLVARAALVDPELTMGCPPAVTAAAGLDALTQLLEAWVSPRANFFTDACCAEGLPRVARSLRRAWSDGTDAQARADLSWSALLSGLALSNAGLGAVHGLAGPIGGAVPAPHGAVCGILVAPVTEANVRALRRRASGHPALERYARAACWLTGRSDAAAEDGVAWLYELAQSLQMPRLSRYGFTAGLIPEVVEKALRANSMKTNPIPLTADELSAVLEAVI
ncbi:iron-containing alcohol dehydrogenase [Limisphaera ngatamarikiensis]|uniref:Iron-containing alcohol dehydrogenase n=1 Tax=Limisphaera ngatamarikiensis TaxID=1324935 RepID=A0A6M1RGJ9_9BACT|nr:iron-containing alcohol dehydrogenase [Limisphaera ngatamarikiensis]NGO38726.1 iron-containing alcohol dehydrogenase [Limisphaera ngatamarikiensis]